MQQQRLNGFTLIEVIIALAIIGILATIACPSYQSFLIKSHRSDAISSLLQHQFTLEQCYAENLSYKKTCDSLPKYPQASEQGYYTINLSNLDSSSYTLTATPRGNQKEDSLCTRFAVTQTNIKTAINSSGQLEAQCWLF